MINVHYAKRIWTPFADTPSSFRLEKPFQYYFYTLTRESVCLTLQDVITGILYTNCPVLIATRYLWGCRRKQSLPCITAFSSKVKIKYMKQKSLYVLKQIKWINLIDGLTLAMKIYSS